MKRKILIVEDEQDIIDLLTLTFSTLETCEILCANDSDTASDILHKHIPDIVLLDIQQTKSNGYDLCKSIRMNPIMSQIRVVILSGMSQQNDILKALEMGADEYITKPFTSSALLKIIESLLRNTQSE